MPPAIVTIGRRIIDDLDRRFDALDTDEDDEIELQELFRLYETGSGAADAILRFYDASGDNVIDRDEFKKVGLVLLSNQKFRVADTDDSGALSLEEFITSLGTMGFSKKFAKEIFRRADADKSGEIDRMEFLDAMLMFIADYDDINEIVGEDDDDDDEPQHVTPVEAVPDATPEIAKPKQTLGSRIMELLANEFDDLDVNNTGVLTEAEIRDIPSLQEDQVNKMLNYIDLDGSGAISKQEFVNVGLLLNVKELFSKYDVNKNESLSKSELDALLQELGYTPEESTKIFKMSDIDRDGAISEMEFYQALLLTFSAPPNSNQIKLFLNDEIDDDDLELTFGQEVVVSTDTSMLNLHLSILREETDGGKTVKRQYKAVFPTRLQAKSSGKLLEEEPEDEEDTALTYEMDPNFFEESDSVKNVIDLKYETPIAMGASDAVQFTAVVNMIFDKKTAQNVIVTGTKQVLIPIKIQTLKSALEEELYFTANKIAKFGNGAQ